MSDDAHHELRKRALRNVRGLVDKMHAEEQSNRRAQRRLVGLVAIVAISFVALLIALVVMRKPGEARMIVTTPEKAPPASTAPR
jgi:hypothetical protein